MRIAALNRGSTIEVNIRGDVFRARVEDTYNGRIRISPLAPGRGYFSCTPRQVRRILEREPHHA